MDPLIEHAGVWRRGRWRARNDYTPPAYVCRYLADLADFGQPEDAFAARGLIMDFARHSFARRASIAPFYAARARGEVGGFTVPAVNVRGMTFDFATALFRALQVTGGVAIFEINRAELGFTGQTPAEFATRILAAAVAEHYTGPVFLQADHMMLDANAFAANPADEVDAVWALIASCIDAGFLNIDIDASTLVDLSYAEVADQQRTNAEVTAELARRIRGREPKTIEISIGGEIGEVGAHNSTPAELQAYAGQVDALFAGTHLRKVSVQTGTKHGGVILPDGSVADAALDFDTLRELSQMAREQFGMAGAVQHGASTLPDAAFSRFPEVEAAEVHLATVFQNLVFDHPSFPAELRREIEAYALEHLAADRKPRESDAQFLHGARRKLWKPFKEALRDLDTKDRDAIVRTLTERFTELLRALGTANLHRSVARAVYGSEAFLP
jgi:fructose/tagatose bisphosphate aldolase